MLKILAVVPALISAIMWLQFLYSWRRTVRPLWSGKYIPLKARMVQYHPGRILGAEYTFTYQGEEHSDTFSPTSNDAFQIGSEFYIYYNPQTNYSFLGRHRQVPVSYIVFRCFFNCLPLLAYLFFYLVSIGGISLSPEQIYARMSVVFLLPVAMLAYNFPRWRQYRHFARSSWSMAIDAVVERQEISAKKDRLVYRSTDPESPFTGELILPRHPMWYDTGDLMTVYYNTRSEKTMPMFRADRKRLAHLNVVGGFVILGLLLITFARLLLF